MNPMNADQCKRKSRGWSDDMDSHAIVHRLKIVDELYAAWQSLRQARKIIPSPAKVDEQSKEKA